MRNETPLILLVEADESLGRIVASYLCRDGYRVLSFGTLVDAVSAMRTRLRVTPPDLVLLDLDSLEPREVQDLARLEGHQTVLPSVEEPVRGLSELMAFPLLLFAGDRFPTWWARDRQGTSVLYKPFAIQELRRQVGGTLAMTGVGR